MGGAVSTGDNNDELVDNLKEAEYIKDAQVERIFRAVDRADYYLPDHRDIAYKDVAWKHGNIHLSAPCIYSEVLESLKLFPGASFLNLGSGTGYLSTLAGLMIGPLGVNHGVEQHEDVVEYAKERLTFYTQQCDSFDEFDFCPPQFVVGNCLNLNSSNRLYDRVYCGAACPPEHENYMKNLIKVNGILVMPLNDQLLQIKRTGETNWESRSVLPVSFASLAPKGSSDTADWIDLDEPQSLTLQEICRLKIRGILRDKIKKEHPELLNQRHSGPKPPSKTRSNRHHNPCVLPMRNGMVILSHRGMRNTENEEEAGIYAKEDDSDDDEEDDLPAVYQQMRGFLELAAAHNASRAANGEFTEHAVPGENTTQDEADQGFIEDMESEDSDDPVWPKHSLEKDTIDGENETDNKMDDGAPPSKKQTPDDMSPVAESSKTDPILITCNVSGDRHRSSSGTSISTSYTSGFGTCSSIEDPPEMDFIKESENEDSDVDIGLSSKSHLYTMNGLSHSGNEADNEASSKSDNCNWSSDTDYENGSKVGKWSEDDKKDSSSEENTDDGEHSCHVPCKGQSIPPNTCNSFSHSKNVGTNHSNGEDNPQLKANVTPLLTMRTCLYECVHKLPVPGAMKDYILFYRNTP